MPEKNIYGEAVTTPAVMPGGLVATTSAPNTGALEQTTALDDISRTTVEVNYGEDAATTTTVGSTEEAKTTFPPDYVTTTAVPPVTQATTSAPKGVVSFEALVIKVSDNSVLVEVTAQGDSGLSVGTQATFAVNIKDESYEAGDKVRVTFDGTVQETYPCQLPNVFGVERLG